MLTADHQVLTPASARAVLAAAADPETRVGVALHLTGLRTREVGDLRVADYLLEEGVPKVHTGTLHARTVRLPDFTRTAADAYLATQTADPEDYLLTLRPEVLRRRVRRAMEAAGVDAAVHDLRKAAIAAALAAQTPMLHLEQYFGISKTDPGRKDLAPLREGWDQPIADALDAAFG